MYLEAKDIAELLKVSERQAYNLMHKMPHHKIGRTIRVTQEVFQNFMTGNEKSPL